MNRWAVVVLCMVCCVAAASSGQSTSEGLVISDVTVISPERLQPLEHAYVRILDGKIAELSLKPLKGEHEIEGKGRYLIPGLIDSHVHLAVPPGFPAAMTLEQARSHPDVVAATLAQDPKSYLFYGFTTVVDLIGSPDRAARWNAVAIRPDAYFCEGAAIIKGQIRFVLFPRFSYGIAGQVQIPPIGDPAQHTPQAVTERMASDGATCVKTIYEKFVDMTPSVDELKALVTAAHSHHLPVFIHANRKDAQAVAAAAGVDVIAHGMWLDPNEGAALDEGERQILASIIKNKIGYQPTTQVIVGELEMFDDKYLARPELRRAYPSSFIDWCVDKQNGCAGKFWTRSAPASAASRSRAAIARGQEVTRMLAAADANLLFGSDTPSDAIYTNPPGLNGRLEMDNWIAAGVSLKKLFAALTVDNARVLHLEGQLGTVEPGKTANLLLLRSDPLHTVEAYDAIETVFLHGRPIRRTELSAR